MFTKKMKRYLGCTFLFNFKHICLGTYQLIRHYPLISAKNKISLFECLYKYSILCFANKITLREFFEFGMFERKKTLEEQREYLSRGLQLKFFIKTFNEHYDVLLNNKKVFKDLCKAYDIPTPKILGRITLGDSSSIEQCSTALKHVLEEIKEYPVMLKPFYGLSGKGIQKITGFDKDRGSLKFPNDEKRLDLFVVKMKNSEFKEFFVEEFIQQHEMCETIFPNAVNSVRVQTFVEGTHVYIPGAMLKIGMGDNWVDNVGLNQFVSLIDLETGMLTRTIRIQGHSIAEIAGGKYIVEQNKHPDTGIQITGRKLPFWKEVKQLAVHCSRQFNMFRSIGWDIAITQNGPIVIEGNVDWTAKYQQLLCGGIYKGSIKTIIDGGLKKK